MGAATNEVHATDGETGTSPATNEVHARVAHSLFPRSRS